MPRLITTYLALFIASTFFTVFAAAITPVTNSTPLFLEEISKEEIDQAKLVSSFVTQIRRSNLDPWSLKKLGQLKSADLLPQLTKIISLANDISKSKSSGQFLETCSAEGSISKLVPTNNIERIIADELIVMCKVRFIENLLTSKSFKTLSSDEKQYMESNIRFYLLKDRRHLLKRYLKMLDRDSDIHQYLSSLITDAYIKYDIIAEKDLVTLLDIGNSLTGHIQNSGLRGLAGNILFEREFRNLILASFDQSNSGQKQSELVGQAISFYSQNTSFIRQRVAWLNYIMLGKELAHLSQWHLSKEIFDHAHRIAVGAEQIDETLFQSLFLRVLKKDKRELHEFIDNNKLLKRFDQLSSKLQFWIAYSLENSGKKDVSLRLFERLLANNPLSFYTIVAQREYQILNNKPYIPPSLSMPLISKENLSPAFKKAVKRLRLWIKVNDRFLAEKEIQRIKNVSIKYALVKNDGNISAQDFKRFAMLQTTELLNHEKAYLTSFKVLYNALEDGSVPVTTATIEYLFPAPYLEQIKSIDQDIDPLLVLSLIRQESAFNPEARSHVGARGLMQLMPATARELKKGVRTQQLVDPNLNLRLGIRYFKRLLKKYDGNLIHSLAAYNAGEGNLKRWMGPKLDHTDPLVVIESIPYKETRKYVKLIYRNIFFYKYLANDSSFFKLPFADSFNARSIATASRIPAETLDINKQSP